MGDWIGELQAKVDEAMKPRYRFIGPTALLCFGGGSMFALPCYQFEDQHGSAFTCTRDWFRINVLTGKG